MPRKNIGLSAFFVTQYLNPDYWADKSPMLQAALDAADGDFLAKYIVNRLQAAGWVVEAAYAIIHDKDSREVWSESQCRKVIELKPAHLHCAVKFDKNYNAGATIDAIAKAIGVEPQYVEKPKSGKYSWDNICAYLIHAKDVEKYQYPPEEVHTVCGLPYSELYEERKVTWQRGRAQKGLDAAKRDAPWLEAEVLCGHITRAQVLLTDDLYQIYARNKRRIDDAFDTYGQRKIYKAIEALARGDFKTRVYYITGESGQGKTQLAKKIIAEIVKMAKEKGEDWSVCCSASSNPVDDYRGEEILFMDDVRGNSMRADDWLKLLDPYNASPSSARYHNRTVPARVVVITSILSPGAFFYYARSGASGCGESEATDQFLRRLEACIKVYTCTTDSGEGSQHKKCILTYRPVHTKEAIYPIEGNENELSACRMVPDRYMSYAEGFKEGISPDVIVAKAVACEVTGVESPKSLPGIERDFRYATAKIKNGFYGKEVVVQGMNPEPRFITEDEAKNKNYDAGSFNDDLKELAWNDKNLASYEEPNV